MPNKRPRKTTRGTTPRDVLDRAASMVAEGQTIRSTAKAYNIDRMTLTRFIQRKKDNPNPDIGYEKLIKTKRIFTLQMERDLSDHIKTLSNMFHGLSKSKCLKLAFEFGVKNGINVPKSWTEKEAAGQDWWIAFKARNHLSIREPEATSRGRASAFNRTTHKEFFDNLQELTDRYKFRPSQILNMDETGCTTVQNPGSVVTATGVKQVGSVTSGERGELVTVAYTVKADGNVLPPMMIFPRVNYKDWFIRGGPVGCIGRATRSGWINENEFFRYLQHIKTQTNCSTENPVLLILDNHESHCSIINIDFAKSNGIILLTIPPHTSHRLQPLDVSVFGPFKKLYNRAMDDWMRSNPGKNVTIYDIPSFVKSAQMNALTQQNITAGFKKTGIYPFSRETFSEVEFAPSQPTDRPDPRIEHITENEKAMDSSTDGSESPQPSSSGTSTSTTAEGYVSPSNILPLPKAMPRKQCTQNRRKRKTQILTDTPVRNSIEAQIKQKENRKPGKSRKNLIFDKPQPNIDNEVESSSENTESDLEIEDTDTDVESDNEIIEGDFVVVKVAGKSRYLNYIVRIESCDQNGEYLGVFLKKVTGRIRDGPPNFTLNADDESYFVKSDILKKLPTPTLAGGTARRENYFSFPNTKLENWDLN